MTAQRALIDLPAPAHSRATVALDEFNALAMEYSALLETQRALLAAGNIDGVADTMTRGDMVARQVAACGRRLAPWREAVDSRAYNGPRTSNLTRRFGEVTSRANQLAAAAARVEALCLHKRDEAADEMHRIQSSAAMPAHAARRYASVARVSALDTRG